MRLVAGPPVDESGDRRARSWQPAQVRTVQRSRPVSLVPEEVFSQNVRAVPPFQEGRLLVRPPLTPSRNDEGDSLAHRFPSAAAGMGGHGAEEDRAMETAEPLRPSMPGAESPNPTLSAKVCRLNSRTSERCGNSRCNAVSQRFRARRNRGGNCKTRRSSTVSSSFFLHEPVRVWGARRVTERAGRGVRH
jgi:hypothetical protein